MSEKGGWGVARRRLVLLGLAAAALIGCTGAPVDSSTSPAAATSSAHPVSAPPVPVAAGSEQPRLPASATAASLVGLSKAELTSLIGAPKWTRRENPAEVWQYQGASCVLDVYLYAENGAPRVLHAEARGETAQPVTLAACLKRIEVERRPPAPAS